MKLGAISPMSPPRETPSKLRRHVYARPFLDSKILRARGRNGKSGKEKKQRCRDDTNFRHSLVKSLKCPFLQIAFDLY